MTEKMVTSKSHNMPLPVAVTVLFCTMNAVLDFCDISPSTYRGLTEM